MARSSGATIADRITAEVLPLAAGLMRSEDSS